MQEEHSPNIIVQLTARSVLLLAVTILAIWALVVFNDLLLLLWLATLLAIALAPPVARLARWHVPRPLAVLLVYLALLGGAGLLVSLLAPLVVAQGSQLVAEVPSIVQEAVQLPRRWLAPYVPALAQNLATSNWIQQLATAAGPLAGKFGGVFVAFGRALTTLVVDTLVVVVMACYLNLDPEVAPRLIDAVVPASYRPTAAALAHELGLRLGQWVRAQLAVALFFGGTFGLGLALLGVPYAVTLGLTGAVLELIPYAGVTVTTILAIALALPTSPWLALAVLGLALVVAAIEAHVVAPKLIGDRVGLHPLLIIIALVVGAEVKGELGVLVAVPVAVALKVVFDFFQTVAAEPPAAPVVTQDDAAGQATILSPAPAATHGDSTIAAVK